MSHDNFSAPMPWIGRYIVAASLICILAMLADAVQGIRRRKFWLPCRFFTFNAASLTLLGVVVKLPLDLNNPMPGETDQMAKLSSVVFMSTAMANFMPSLALMDNKDIFMDMAALGILVMTLVVNVCIELGTGVIYSEKIEHIVVMLSIVFLFVIMCFSALTVPTIKSYLELEYRERGNMIEIEDLVYGEKPVEVKLKENLRKFFVMAETGNPLFVMARSATCSACCAICCLNGLLLLEVSLRDNLFGAHVKSMSDYRRSTYCISRIQSVGVAVGTLSSLIRWFSIATIKSSGGSMMKIKIEKHWLERLKDCKDSPFALQIKNPKCRKLVQQIQNLILENCIRVQILIVVVSKIVQLFPILLVTLLRSCYCSSSWCNNVLNSDKEGISRYVLHLEGEEELTQVMANKKDDTSWMMEIGRKQKPKHLMELLQKLTDFRGVSNFDINQIPYPQFQEPPNGWKMTIVTLTAIATRIPNIDHKIVDNLLLSVSQGLKYVSFIEDNILGTNGNSEKNKRAADIAWLELYLYRRWLDQDLQKMSLQRKTINEILQNFAYTAQNYVTGLKNDYSRKPTKVITANSMYQMSQIILQDSEKIEDQTEVQFFNYISVMIAGVVGACLINMPYAITKKCSASAIEEREENVQHAIRLLGEAEEIIKSLQKHETITPTNSSNSDSESSNSDETRITIE